MRWNDKLELNMEQMLISMILVALALRSSLYVNIGL